MPTFLASTGELSEGDLLLIFLSGCSAVLPIVLFYLMARGTPTHALLGIVVLACVAGAVSAVGAITAAEQFPGEGRVSGLALGATSATAIFGGLTPYVAQILTERTGWTLLPGAMIAVVGVCALPVMIALPETAPGKRIGLANMRQFPPQNGRARWP